MGREPTKATGNPYFECRKKAASYDNRLSSREKAAELLGMSPSSLADYELGVTKCVPVDKAVLMADLYNAPELKNLYCCNECPIGRGAAMATEIEDIRGIALRLLVDGDIDDIKGEIAAIAKDGVIDGTEKNRMQEAMRQLDEVGKIISELRLWCEKNMGGGATHG